MTATGVLFLSIGSIVLTGPGRAQGEGPVPSEPPPVAEEQSQAGQAPTKVELPEDLREMLAAIDDFGQEGDLETARGILREVISGLGELELESDQDWIGVLIALDERAGKLGSFEEQRIIRSSIVEVSTRLLPPMHPELIGVKLDLAVTKYKLGEFSAARELLEEVVQAWTPLLPAGHQDLIGAKSNLAATKLELGDLPGARKLFEDVLEARRQLLPPGHTDLLHAKQNLAATDWALGDYLRARELYGEVLEARKRFLPPNHPDLLAAKLNFAATIRRLGDPKGAHELELQVFEAWSRLLPPEHPNLLKVKTNLAGTKCELDDLQGAQVLQEEVLETRVGLFPSDHPALYMAKQNLAMTRIELGDLVGARALLGSLLKGMRARVRSRRADSPRAAREAAQSEIRRLFVVLHLSFLTDIEQQLVPDFFETLEELRASSVASVEIALALADRAELSELRDQTLVMRARVQDHAVSPPTEAKSLEAWRKELAKLTQERDRLEYSMRSRLTEAGVFALGIEMGEIARRLDGGAAAVSYLRYPKYFERNPDTGRTPAPIDFFFAFLVRPNGSIQRIDLGRASDIDEQLYLWRAELGKPANARGIGLLGKPLSRSDTKGESTGEKLRNLVLDPILKRAPDLQSLHICPDDILYLIPFDALPMDEGRVGDHLVIRTEVSMLRLIRPPRPSTAAPGIVLAGGVDYDARPASPSYRIAEAIAPPVDYSATGTAGDRSGNVAAGFLPLPETGQEVNKIATVFESSFDIEPVVLIGERATKAALAEGVQDARYLHLATHGWFASEVFRSHLDELADPSERRLFEKAEETLRGFAPEALCGLALAGANLGRDAVGRVLGILTAEELSSIDMRNCELAVLSACETNVGIRRAGQGIQSLQTALHAAGARTTITSLWKVDDAATRRLMELFYTKLWKDKLGKADALWEAKMALRSEGHPVKDWAGWVLTGDPD